MIPSFRRITTCQLKAIPKLMKILVLTLILCAMYAYAMSTGVAHFIMPTTHATAATVHGTTSGNTSHAAAGHGTTSGNTSHAGSHAVHNPFPNLWGGFYTMVLLFLSEDFLLHTNAPFVEKSWVAASILNAFVLFTNVFLAGIIISIGSGKIKMYVSSIIS
jgi:hypothetical protein